MPNFIFVINLITMPVSLRKYCSQLYNMDCGELIRKVG